MLKNITRRQRKTFFEYRRDFDYGDGSGFCFDCDKDGNLLPMPEAAMRNYQECLAHPERFETFNKVIRIEHTYTENAHGTCICGRDVELYDQYRGACQCECGRWYNLFGQELIDPRYWEDDDEDYYGWEDEYV